MKYRAMLTRIYLVKNVSPSKLIDTEGWQMLSFLIHDQYTNSNQNISELLELANNLFVFCLI